MAHKSLKICLLGVLLMCSGCVAYDEGPGSAYGYGGGGYYGYQPDYPWGSSVNVDIVNGYGRGWHPSHGGWGHPSPPSHHAPAHGAAIRSGGPRGGDGGHHGGGRDGDDRGHNR